MGLLDVVLSSWASELAAGRSMGGKPSLFSTDEVISSDDGCPFPFDFSLMGRII
jgi:hypothetical protein